MSILENGPGNWVNLGPPEPVYTYQSTSSGTIGPDMISSLGLDPQAPRQHFILALGGIPNLFSNLGLLGQSPHIQTGFGNLPGLFSGNYGIYDGE